MSGDLAPIYVDLDGTLIRSDLLLESLLQTARAAPLQLLRIPVWLLGGRARLKQRLARHGAVDVSTLPYREDLLALLRERARLGHKLVLATAANQQLAVAVADHLGLFADTLASSEKTNLKGDRKTQAIVEHAGGRPFIYAGNDRADIPIWKRAAAGILVGTPRAVAAAAKHVTKIEAELPGARATAATWLRQLRVYQWAKNVLVFVPLLTAHLWMDAAALGNAALAFIAFSLCASGIYVVNDLLDLPSDRQHPNKRLRPFASGAMPIWHGLLAAPLLVSVGLAIASTVSLRFAGVTAIYLGLTTAYSLRLKTYVLIDVMTLAALYAIRVIAGAVAIDVQTSFWLLGFSMSIFLSLALLKRYSELLTVAELNRSSASGRDYRVADQGVVQAMGVASGIAAVLVFALFINSNGVAGAYSRPYILWILCCTFLYWISRLWLKAARGEMHDDPLLYAARDRASLVMLLVSIGAVVGAV